MRSELVTKERLLAEWWKKLMKPTNMKFGEQLLTLLMIWGKVQKLMSQKTSLFIFMTGMETSIMKT